MDNLKAKIEEEIKNLQADIRQQIEKYKQLQEELSREESEYNSSIQNLSHDEKQIAFLEESLKKIEEQKEKINKESFIKKLMRSHKETIKNLDGQILYNKEKIETLKSLVDKTKQKNAEYEEKKKYLDSVKLHDLKLKEEKLKNSKYAKDMAISNLLKTNNREEMLKSLINEDQSYLKLANTNDDIEVFEIYLSEKIKTATESNDKKMIELFEKCLNEVKNPKTPENDKYKIPDSILFKVLIQNELANSNDIYLSSSLDELVNLYLKNDCELDEAKGKEIELLITSKLSETLNTVTLDNDKIKLICQNEKCIEGHITLDMLNKDTIEKIKEGNKTIIDQINTPVCEEDLALVRTCNDLPNSNNELVSVSHRDYFSPLSHSFFRTEGESFEKPVSSLYRSTVHFTVNGLVSNHMAGDFSGNDFFYIDDFTAHKNENLLSLEVEDTYFKDGVRLSDNSVICMGKEKLQSMRNNNEANEFLSNHKIFVYDLKNDFDQLKNSDPAQIENAIAKYCLICLEKPCYAVSDHGYQNTEREDYNSKAPEDMLDFVREYATEHGYDKVKHSYSIYDQQDTKISNDIARNSMKKHYLYVVEHSNVDQAKKEKMVGYLDYLQDYFTESNQEFSKEDKLYKNTSSNKKDQDYITRQEFSETTQDFINSIGIEEYNRLTKEYNEQYEEMIRKEHAKEELNGIVQKAISGYSKV